MTTITHEQIATWTTKSPLDLTVGDLVFESGAVLRVVSLNSEWIDRDTARAVKNWKTELVTGETPWADCNRWMTAGEFNIQGNELAHVAVVTMAADR